VSQQAGPGSPVSVSGDAVHLSLKVTPKASSDRFGGVVLDAAEVAHLQVFVTAVPEDGAANASVIRLLSKRWRLPKSAFEIVRGAADRWKVVAIVSGKSGKPAALAERIKADL
jgi:hypothetical protein